jgi:drug/metabolite transporter (DMT)-like permease
MTAEAGKGDDVRRGIAYTVLAVFFFATQDAATKFLVGGYSPFQMTMLRFWAFCLMAVVIAARKGPVRVAFRSGAPWTQALRPVLLVADIWLFMFALASVPLAELQAIVMVYPFMVTLAAVPVLGERVGVFRIAAILVGFAGAMVIVRPGGVPLGPGVLYAVGSAATYALYLVLTRRVSRTDSLETSMLYVGVGGLVMTTAVGVFFWRTPDAASLGLMLYIMATGCAGHGLIILALSLAPASTLQPFNYTALPWGILFSWLLFGHLIDAVSLVGAAVIVGAGIVITIRERTRRLARAVVPSLPGKE